MKVCDGRNSFLIYYEPCGGQKKSGVTVVECRVAEYRRSKWKADKATSFDITKRFRWA